MTNQQTEPKAESYTPGPWKALDGAILCENVNSYGNFIITLYGRGDNALTAEDLANARLIAAAPELLEACVSMLKRLEIYPEGSLGLLLLDERETMRAAIAKATTPPSASNTD